MSYIAKKVLSFSLALVVFSTLFAVVPAFVRVPGKPVAHAIVLSCSDGSNPPAGMFSNCPAPDCKTNNKFLGIIPTWYEYFGSDYGVVPSNPSNTSIPPTCGVIGGEITDHVVQVGLALVDILLRVGALVAVAFVMMGGYKYISSQGEPKNIEGAMATIVNASIGLGIVITATVLVAFIGNKLGG